MSTTAEPDRIVGPFADFGADIDVDVEDLTIAVPRLFFAPLADAEEVASALARAIAWVKQEQSKRGEA